MQYFWFLGNQARELIQTKSHRSRGKSRKVKKMQDETEGAMKISARRASKRAPTWYSCTITPKSLSGQPLDRVWIRRSRGWPERDFGVMVQLCHVGARFEALDALIFIAPSVSSCIFFTFLDFPLERCAVSLVTNVKSNAMIKNVKLPERKRFPSTSFQREI